MQKWVTKIIAFFRESYVGFTGFWYDFNAQEAKDLLQLIGFLDGCQKSANFNVEIEMNLQDVNNIKCCRCRWRLCSLAVRMLSQSSILGSILYYFSKSLIEIKLRFNSVFFLKYSTYQSFQIMGTLQINLIFPLNIALLLFSQVWFNNFTILIGWIGRVRQSTFLGNMMLSLPVSSSKTK